MLIQRAGTGTLPPPGFTTPPWGALAAAWDASVLTPSTPTVTLGPATIVLGHNDCEGDDLNPEVTYDVAGHTFGWDNESPARRVEVGRVRMEWRPVTNGEYLAFWKGEAGGERVAFPPSWVSTDNGRIEVCFSSLDHPTSAHSNAGAAGPHAVWTGADERRQALASTDVVRRPARVRPIQGRTTSDGA